MKVAMTLTGAKSISEISGDSLVQELGKSLPTALAPMSKGDAPERLARESPVNFCYSAPRI
ncbi:L-lactate dehydrogenase [Salmonella enterica subsp. enterica]|uniref:L-lactate dehydrogenase n=1 Tax=Salmonella enterica I TaxID=59201 RepID=A0A447N207_SALET|nr:L-lactate dehydrogenase [Salmonella enterica subsp. enterica]